MAQAVLVVVVCVLFSWEKQGSSAVTTVFVQKGKDLHLDVNKPVDIPEFTEFRWRFNDTHNVVRVFPDKRARIIDSYAGRVEFYVQNHSLLLKNVQHNDSGDYIALITGDENQLLTEYQVIIEDPVSPVQLSVNSVSNSTESCSLTVTCSTEDSLISSTFSCDTQTCNQEGGEQSEVTISGPSLRVYVLNDSIICNHSNQVSWTRDIKEIWPLCSLNTGTSEGTIIAIGIVIPVFLLCICFLYRRITNKQKRKNSENAIYESIQDLNLNQTPNQKTTEDASGLSPNSTYALLGFPAAPKPENIYVLITEVPKFDHHPELKNTENNNDLVHSQD